MSLDRKPRILLVGAYERDNFGDMLFLLQSRAFLTDFETVAAAPFANASTSVLDTPVASYGHLLRSEPFDYVLTVGGEVGVTTAEVALRMAGHAEEAARLSAGGPRAQAELLMRLCGLRELTTPYLPRLSALPDNAGAGLGINSVGLIGLSTASRARRAQVISTLREADIVSVRDRVSAQVLRESDLPHTLAPDLVHSIALTRPRQGDRQMDLALVQASDDVLRRFGHERFADALADCASLERFRVRLFIAGSAPGHDSVASYERIRTRFRAASRGRDLEMSESVRPWDRVDEIGSAGLWIGSSLHGRIVATAYGVPRVSLAKRKLSVYARTWDPEMPFGVTPRNLEDATRSALSPEHRDYLAELGPRLGSLAKANFSTVIETLMKGDPPHRMASRLAALDDRRFEELLALETELSSLKRMLAPQEAVRGVVRRGASLARQAWGRIRY